MGPRNIAKESRWAFTCLPSLLVWPYPALVSEPCHSRQSPIFRVFRTNWSSCSARRRFTHPQLRGRLVLERLFCDTVVILPHTHLHSQSADDPALNPTWRMAVSMPNVLFVRS
jgi:hypothetical protein